MGKLSKTITEKINSPKMLLTGLGLLNKDMPNVLFWQYHALLFRAQIAARAAVWSGASGAAAFFPVAAYFDGNRRDNPKQCQTDKDCPGVIRYKRKHHFRPPAAPGRSSINKNPAAIRSAATVPNPKMPVVNSVPNW
jgi:hypothetical protein